MLLEKECTPERIYTEVKSLLADPARRERMGGSLRQMVRLDSAERICDIVEELTKG